MRARGLPNTWISDEKQTIGTAYGSGMHPQSAIVSESGLYSLILKSCKPEAQPHPIARHG